MDARGPYTRVYIQKDYSPAGGDFTGDPNHTAQCRYIQGAHYNVCITQLNSSARG